MPRTILSRSVLFLALAAPVAMAQLVIRVPITPGEQLKLNAFIHGREILAIKDYRSPDLDSIAPVEQFLFRKAVLLGGLDARFEDVLVPNSARARLSIREGDVVGGGVAEWLVYSENSPGAYLVSDAVIPDGAYEKGLYTTPEKCRRLRIRSLADLAGKSAVTSRTWEVDWRTLAGLRLKELESAPTRAMQFRMVAGGRADFTPQDFAATPDLAIEEEGVRLVPVPGVKIALRGSRHFFISRKHPEGPRVFQALQAGLRILRRRGEIQRALVESGVRNPAVRNWTLLNAPGGESKAR